MLTGGGVRNHARQRIRVTPDTRRRVVAVVDLTDVRRAVGHRAQQVSNCRNGIVRFIHPMPSVLTDCRREASEERPMLVEGQRVTTCNRSLACMLQQHSEPHLEDVFGQRHRSSLQGKRGVVNVETMTERKVLTMKDVYQ